MKAQPKVKFIQKKTQPFTPLGRIRANELLPTAAESGQIKLEISSNQNGEKRDFPAVDLKSMTATAEACKIKFTAIITKTLSLIPRRHGGVTTSPGTTAERSYRSFISTITEER